MLASLSLLLHFASTLATSPSIHTDLSCRFSLTAWNVSGDSQNSTGAPLVLGQDGAVYDGPSYQVTSTFASYQENVYPTLSLSNGSLRAYRASGVWETNATAVASGGLLSWYTSPLFNRDAARIYSAVEQHDAGVLGVAAYGFDNLWSLCLFGGAVPGVTQTNVVFNVSADTNTSPHELGYDPHSCWKVALHLVPAGNSVC
ncbi:hypothetical protein MSAN_02451000 [Mycena sanguinolenta]|uniref:Uncharacterized protein n=1 Tax=Mycena sanguinolenta TaxID=230812 RepID=A0A8H7CCP1_9AGAR|nr:hypothetical protein MSAN_02451000 [Mycena sanguinolenta]